MSERQGLIFQIIALHVWRHGKYVVGCEVCEMIKSGKWPR